MDITTMMFAMMLVKSLPGSVSAEAVAAAARAVEAGELAETHNMGVSVSGTDLVFESVSGS